MINWQHIPEKLSPVALQIGPVEIHWYGIMYLVAFTCTYLLMRYRLKHEKRFKKYTNEQILDLLLWLIVGLIIGARLGYALFYNFEYFLHRPLEIILPFSLGENGATFTGISGMSYHGGAIGVFLAGVLFVRKNKMNLWDLADLIAPCIPLGYTFGRLGNFINGELWGRTTESAIGMHFPHAPGDMLRHPSQLYEALFEGIVLFGVLWSLRKLPEKKNIPSGTMLVFYLLGYGVVRFAIEFFREPDAHLGFIFGSLSMGQVLCLGMILAAFALFTYLRHTNLRKST